jgi:hypothetical protein
MNGLNSRYAVLEIDDNFIGVEGYTKPGWYFWDETETNLIGPFQNETRAQIAQDVYGAKI